MSWLPLTTQSRINQEITQSINKVDKILHILEKWEEQQVINVTSRRLSFPYDLTHVSSDDDKLIRRLQHHFRLVKLNMGKLEQFQTITVEAELDKHLVILHTLVKDLKYFGVSAFMIKLDLQHIARKISDLLSQFPLLSVVDEVYQDKSYYYYLPGIHTNVEGLIKCEAFKEVKHKFMELEIERKICLLSFAVFPENREVHRTMLMYWWIGERILPVEGAEEAVKEVLKEFTEKILVEPVEERRKVAPNSYKMSPFVHASVVLLSKQIGVFDIYGKECNKPSMHTSDKGKIFILEESVIQREATVRKRPSEDIETVFNVSESNLDFAIKWFSRDPRRLRRFTMDPEEDLFKSLHVFYLGRWERSKKRQIEVKNDELMDFLRYVRQVKVLSLQGISTIKSINRSLCNLHELIVLDLRDCSELTELPGKMDYLENLVYLDMTGCYKLEWIPFRLCLLRKLEVLKGLVVSEAFYEKSAFRLCFLKKFQKLRKLSIEIYQDNFSVREMMLDLESLTALTSLKVTWRKDPDSPCPVVAPVLTRDPDGVVVQLKKLSLQCFPDEELPEWFNPEKLIHLKKLCIGGGKKLKGFGKYLPEEPTKCGVEVLRLTSLPKLRVGWLELKKVYFPNLSFLECYECPRVTLTPCDGNGIWTSDQDSTIPE